MTWNSLIQRHFEHNKSTSFWHWERESSKLPIDEFQMEDLVWTDHVTFGSGLHRGSKLVVVLWERLDDFISGEQHRPLYPYGFNVKVIRRNLPNSLRSPRAHSAALLVWFDLLPSILHCQLWFSPLIFLLHRFFDWHSLIQLFAHVFHWHSYVIRKRLHVHLCHSGFRIHHSLFCCVNSRYRCKFGQEDKSPVVPNDIKAFLRAIQKRRKKIQDQKKKLPKYDSFLVNKTTDAKVKHIGKNVVGDSIKRGGQKCFVAKKNLLLILYCACWFMRIQYTSIDVVSTAIDQWSMDSDMH